MSGEVSQQVQPLRYEADGVLVDLPRGGRVVDRVDDRRDPLRIEQQRLGRGVAGREDREATKPALLHIEIAIVGLHGPQDDGDHPEVGELGLALVVPGQLRQHAQAVVDHLRVTRVARQGLDRGLRALQPDDVASVLGVKAQGLQRREGVAVDVRVLGKALHGVDERVDPPLLRDVLAPLGGRGRQGVQRPAAVLLNARVHVERVQILNDGLDCPEPVQLGTTLWVLGGRSDEVVRVLLDDGVIGEVLHGRDDWLKPVGVVDLVHVLLTVVAPVHQQPQALLIRPLVRGAALHRGNGRVDALTVLLDCVEDLLVALRRDLLQ
mmetsp:Transcript_53471/g.152557  ORF Transcript_53471/g.152557 Transcript_53471/m.152557 type:complete len:322 (-) Transcript_53471:527-1492(-)